MLHLEPGLRFRSSPKLDALLALPYLISKKFYFFLVCLVSIAILLENATWIQILLPILHGSLCLQDVYWRAFILLKHWKIQLLCLENVPAKCRRSWLQKTTSFQDQMNGRILGFFFTEFKPQPSTLYCFCLLQGILRDYRHFKTLKDLELQCIRPTDANQ